MEFLHYTDPGEYRKAVESYLVRDEAKNNLMVGIVLQLSNRGIAASDPELAPFLCAVKDQGEVIAASVMTPPYNLVLTDCPQPTVDLIASGVHNMGRRIPGFLGPTNSAGEFKNIWKTLTGQEAGLHRSMRVYGLVKVTPVSGVSGFCEPAVMDDLEFVTRWCNDFAHEIDTLPPQNIQAIVERGDVCLWKDPDPVSMAVAGSRTLNGTRVGGVYTPPEYRKHGYASAVTAAASQKILDSGKKFCYLFTDLANPTSNHIYQEIGYRPVCDFGEYQF